MANIMNSPSANYNNFYGSSYIPYNIIQHLFLDEDIWKLLYYTTSDALEQPNLTAKQKAALVWTGQDDQENYRVFLTQMQENVTTVQSVVLRLYKQRVRPVDVSHGVILYTLEIDCKTKLGMLNDCRSRLDVLWDEAMKMIVGKDVGGLGMLFFYQGSGGDSNCSSVVTYGNGKDYMGYTITFGVRMSSLENNQC